MTVYVIEADMSGSIIDAVKARDALGIAIGALSKTVKESISFHDYKDSLCGAPVVLLECSEAFLEQVKQLPGCKKAFEVWANIETEPSATLQQYFITGRPPLPKYRLPKGPPF